MNYASIARALGNYCNILRDDNMSDRSYADQLIDLLFRSMADERSCPRRNQLGPIAVRYPWPFRMSCGGNAPHSHDGRKLVGQGNAPCALALLIGKPHVAREFSK